MVVEGSEGEREKRVDFAVVTGLDFQAALWQKGLTLLMPERSGPIQGFLGTDSLYDWLKAFSTNPVLAHSYRADKWSTPSLRCTSKIESPGGFLCPGYSISG